MASTAEIQIKLSNGKEAGKTINELTGQSAKLAREIKKLEVGSEEYIKATEDYKKVAGRLKDVKKEAFDTAQAQKELNSMLTDMIPFKDEFSKLGTGIKGVGASIGNATKQTKLWKVALASTGIGLLVVALGSLAAWLTKTQKGMDLVGKVSASLQTIFRVLIERVATFGEGMAKLLSRDFSGAWESMKKAVSGFGSELVKETKATWANTEAMQALNKEQRQLEQNKASSRAEIEKLKMASDDQTKSEAERLKNAQKAYDMEKKLLDDSISLQQRKIALIQQENKNKGITLTEDDKDLEREAVIELENLREESFTKQTELQNKVNELKRSSAELTEKLSLDETKASEDKIKALEAEQKARDEFIKASIDSELKAREERKQMDADLLEGYKAQQQEQFNIRMQSLVLMAEAEQQMIDQLFLTNQINQEQRDQMLYEAQEKALQDRLSLLMANGQQTSSEYQSIFMELLRLNQEYETGKTEQSKEEEEKRKQLRNEGLSAAAGVAAGFASLLADSAKTSKKSLAVMKAAQSAEVGINTIKEVSGIFSSTSSWGPLGWALGIAQAAIATARGAQAIKKINSTQIEEGGSFADGGPVFGPSHREGGIPFSVSGTPGYEMEGGEIIMSKGVYQDPILRTLASELNYMGGGRRFELGGPVSLSSQPSQSQSNQSPPNISSALIDLRNTEMYLKTIAEATVATAKKPTISTFQIRQDLKLFDEVERDATF